MFHRHQSVILSLLLLLGALGASSATPTIPAASPEEPMASSRLGLVDRDGDVVPFVLIGTESYSFASDRVAVPYTLAELASHQPVDVAGSVKLVGRSPELLPNLFTMFLFRGDDRTLDRPVFMIPCAGVNVIAINGNPSPCTFTAEGDEADIWTFSFTTADLYALAGIKSDKDFCEGRSISTFTLVIRIRWWPQVPPGDLNAATPTADMMFRDQWWALPVKLC